MGELLSPLDIVIFFGSLVGVMALGLWAGRKEDTSEDYFMAGRKTPWWGVAASIFGSNISANQFVGMMGLGFSIGFAQSHFEISAIAGLLVEGLGAEPEFVEQISGGIVVAIDFDDGKSIANLATDGPFVVHALLRDEARVAAARQASVVSR